MTRYSKGQTSEAKAKEKEEKSQSLLTKVLLIKGANAANKRIDSLDALSSGRGVSFKAALSWTDQALNVVPCAYNTSQKPYNIELSNNLKVELVAYNSRLSPAHATASPPPIKKSSDKEKLVHLALECEHLKNAVAEIYRAYMQLLARVDEKARQDIRYQQVLKSHARAMGKANLVLVNT